MTSATAGKVATSAKQMMDHFQNTGVFAAMNNLTACVNNLDAAITGKANDINELSTLMQSLIDLMEGQPPTVKASNDRISMDLEQIKANVSELKQKANGGGVPLGGFHFSSYEACLGWVESNMPPDSYHVKVDIMSLLQRIDDPCKYSEDIQQLEIHAHKISRLPEQSAVVASFQTKLPPSLEGPKESRGEQSLPFGTMPSYDHWDPGDGQTGPKSLVNQTMDTMKQSIYSNIEQIMEVHPLGCSLCHEMLRLSVAFWRDLCSEIAEFNRFLLVSSYGADG